jgi:hypothetical protein
MAVDDGWRWMVVDDGWWMMMSITATESVKEQKLNGGSHLSLNQ